MRGPFGEGLQTIDFSAAYTAADRLITAASAVYSKQLSPDENLAVLNSSLRQVEESLLSPQGLPGRPWYKHTIYAPGEYTGYAAVSIPGVNETIDAHDLARAQAQMGELTAALDRAAKTLEAVK